ncbi:MAG: hypothetical protein ACJA2S_003036 [Cyclobacteriaceae bacterium]|jgi:hypothetical protein
MIKFHTEKELHIHDKHQIYRLAKLAKKDKKLFDVVAEHVPFYITLNRRDNLQIIWE